MRPSLTIISLILLALLPQHVIARRNDEAISRPCCQTQPQHPQDSLTQDSLPHHRLREALVLARRPLPRIDLLSPMPSQSLSGEALRQLSALSVADAIRYFSGVQLKDYGGVGGLKTINVRSLGSAHTAVFYDGMQVHNAQNTQVDLSKFSLDNVEAISLYNGQQAQIFQAARGFFSASTLFIRSRSPQFSGERTSSFKTGLKTGSFGLLQPSLLWQQKLNPRLSLSAQTNYLQAHGRYKYRYTNGSYDTTAVRQNGDIQAFRSEWALHAQGRNGSNAQLKAYYYQSERGLPGAIVANRYSHFQRLWDRNFFAQASLQSPVGTRYQSLLQLKYSHDYTRYVDPDYMTLEGALDNRYRQQEFYASWVQQYRWRDWCSLALSTDFIYNTLDANLYRFPYPQRFSYLGALSAAFNWPRLSLQTNLLACYIDEMARSGKQGQDQSRWLPVVSLSWQPFNYQALRLRVFYKTSFRMPSFNDLYYTFVGNSDLRPEWARQWNAGVVWVHQGKPFQAAIQTDVYYNRVTDKIIAMPSANLFRWTMMNLGEVRIQGLETDVQIGWQQDFWQAGLGIAYTYQDAVDITPGSTVYGHQIPYISKHSGSLTASAGYGPWRLHYSFIYTGERYSQKANIPVNHVQPWYTSDLALSRNLPFKAIDLEISIEVNNLFNQYYDVILNFPMPGRSFRLSVQCTI